MLLALVDRDGGFEECADMLSLCVCILVRYAASNLETYLDVLRYEGTKKDVGANEPGNPKPGMLAYCRE